MISELLDASRISDGFDHRRASSFIEGLPELNEPAGMRERLISNISFEGGANPGFPSLL